MGDWKDFLHNADSRSKTMLLLLTIVTGIVTGAFGLCANTLCSTYPTNQPRGCDAYGCGDFVIPRANHDAVDVKCGAGAVVYAPFDGVVHWEPRPFPIANIRDSCCKRGFSIRGTGIWQDYKAHVIFATLLSGVMGRNVSQGEAVATHTSLHCGCYNSSMTDHVHFRLFHRGKVFDPTDNIFCSSGLCIHKLCSTNPPNNLRGCDDKGCGHYGARGKGYSPPNGGVDVKCDAGAEVTAPFDGTLVKVVRPLLIRRCCNIGLQLQGIGQWREYTAKMFYVEPIPGLVEMPVSKGQVIARHIGVHCSNCFGRGTNMIDHIHFELYRNRRRVNPTGYICADELKLIPVRDVGLCTSNLCSSYLSNQARGCDTHGCGNFGASRGTRKHEGVDVKCNGGANVYAPFDGTLVRRANPYTRDSCCNTGFYITGSGAWSGYAAKVFYAEPDPALIGRNVSKGQIIAKHKGLHCGCYPSSMTDHIHFQLYRDDQIVDPTNFVVC